MIGSRPAAVDRPELVGRRPLRWSSSRSADRLFEGVTAVFGLGIVLLVLLVAWELWRGSSAARQVFGFGFITGTTWNPVQGTFGAFPYIFGTLVTSFAALLLAGPIGVGTAIFLVELAPRRLRAPVGFLVEMLAAIPSVIYGLWALFVLVPLVRNHVEPFLGDNLGFLPFFKGTAYGVGFLSASLVLAIMVLPTVTAISQAVIATVPRGQRDGAYALGATRWEVISDVVVPYARSGIIGALILGLGRALGETMAVTMVIGNRGSISWSLFSLGDTMASVIANQFNEADNALFTSALIEIGLLLFVVTVFLNVGARLLVWRLAKSPGGARR
ncbi:MAG: phosphate ABC transporter permease subunit PstC [Thermomicrobiales bacterium]